MSKAKEPFLPIGLLISRASMQAAFQKEESNRQEVVTSEMVEPEPPRDGPKEPLDIGLEAARVGNEKLLRELLESGWSILTQDKYGGTAIHWAAGGGHLGCCKLLLEWNADPLSRLSKGGGKGRTPLHWAARNGHIKVCEWLIDDVGVDPNIATFDKTTPFQLAIWQGRLDICDWLVAKGIDPHQTNDYGCNGSHWVAMSGHLGACQWLMDQGVDMPLNPSYYSSPAAEEQAHLNGVGHTCLHKAAQKGQADFCRFVHSHVGLRPAHLAPDGDGKTPAFLAAEADHPDIAAWIETLPAPDQA